MAELLETTQVGRCYCCLASNDEKRLQNHIVQTHLKMVLQTDRLLLCYICKKIAEKTEQFIKNVQNYQTMFQLFMDATEETIEMVVRKNRLKNNPIVELYVTAPLVITPGDVLTLNGKDEERELYIAQIKQEDGGDLSQSMWEVEEGAGEDSQPLFPNDSIKIESEQLSNSDTELSSENDDKEMESRSNLFKEDSQPQSTNGSSKIESEHLSNSDDDLSSADDDDITYTGSKSNLFRADEERQENVGEFEEQSHSFLKEEYPEADPFPASGSSDEYQPSYEDEESRSFSDGSICDSSADNITPSTIKDGTNHTQPRYIPPPITQRGPYQLQPEYVTSTITRPSQQQGVFTLSTFIQHEPPQSLTTLMPHNTKEHDPDQAQTYLTSQTATEHESQQPQTYIMAQVNTDRLDITQNTTEQESCQLQTYLTQHNTTDLGSCQPQVDVMPQTTEGHQPQGTDCNNLVRKGRNKDFCFYCETHVLNFARHIIRRHYLEVDVQKILASSKKSQTRRKLITDLKKKGNYIANVVRCERPMRMEKGINQSDYLPCPNCLGFYARKQLWKHKKTCSPGLSGKHTQAEAQNLMCRNSSHTPSKALQKVFSRMRADKISFVAKQDPIICEFGENYTKIHREEHFIPVTSRKMRELAKLLIEIRKKKTEIRTLFDALKPQNYDVLVAATKTVAKYDENCDRYCSPTYAMNISTSIKQCCHIAIKRILKTEPSIQCAEMQADLRTLVQLIESSWKFDVSSNAADDLNLKKWNKVTIVPLASDLKSLKDHLCLAAQNAAVQLKRDENSQNTAAYNELVETVFCRALLLNRRRPGELQRLLLSTYVENEHNDYQYEELDRTLTAAEKILVQRFKRIVIRGKRSRGVPVLFSTDVQQDLDLLISLRSKYIDPNNKLLFAKTAGMTSLCGYKVLQKHVKLSGAKNPEAISSTKLRKHLATLTQLFNMTENDIEQLYNFMGHTTGVHRRNYRLPDDIFQTAKISKLLILMEDGKADAYKGKSLDEININMEENLEGQGLDREDILNFAESENTLEEPRNVMTTDMSNNTLPDLETLHNENCTSSGNQPLADVSNKTSRSTKKKRVLVPWTTEQKNLVINHFKKHIRTKKAPKRHECDALKALHPELLDNKDWLKIKVFIQNYYTKN